MVMLANIYNPVMKPLDRIGFRDWRRWATAIAEGATLEIGAGTGLNFSYYEPGARVAAFDLDADMLKEIDNADRAAAQISIVRARAEAVPFPDRYFESCVGTLVFCTIAEPREALAEVKRVLKPGGRLRLVEHVRANSPMLGKIMDVATPLWSHIAGGCHLNRNTLGAVAAAGFQVVAVHQRFAGLLIGIDAIKPADNAETDD